MNERYQSRKFIITTAALVGSMILAAFGKMTPELGLVVGVCVGAYNHYNTKAKEYERRE